VLNARNNEVAMTANAASARHKGARDMEASTGLKK
jgi:hypothetical protein